MKKEVKNNKLERVNKIKKGFRIYSMAVMLIGLTIGTSTNVLAANDPIAVVNNLSDFIFGLTRAIGLIISGYAIVQIGLSFSTHDPSQRANGFMFFAGGLIITFAKEILNMIAG